MQHAAISLEYLRSRAVDDGVSLIEGLTAEQVLAQTDSFRARGYEVWPPCRHTSTDGRCLGHPD